MGAENDYILGLSESNCGLFNQQVQKDWPAFSSSTQTKYQDFFTRIGGLFGVQKVDVNTAQSICRYISWADIQSIVLTVDVTSEDLTNCMNLATDVNNFYLQVNKELNYIGAVEFAKQTKDYVTSMMGLTLFSESYFYKTNTVKENLALREDRLRNNAASRPNFHLYQTNEINLRYILQGFQSSLNYEKTHALRAPSATSSNIVLELTYTSGDYYVEVTYNDSPVILGGCTVSPCKALDFVGHLNDLIATTNGKNVVDVCASTSPAQSFSKFLVQ